MERTKIFRIFYKLGGSTFKQKATHKEEVEKKKFAAAVAYAEKIAQKKKLRVAMVAEIPMGPKEWNKLPEEQKNFQEIKQGLFS